MKRLFLTFVFISFVGAVVPMDTGEAVTPGGPEEINSGKELTDYKNEINNLNKKILAIENKRQLKAAVTFFVGSLLCCGLSVCVVRSLISPDLASDYELLQAQHDLQLALEENDVLSGRLNVFTDVMNLASEMATKSASKFLTIATEFSSELLFNNSTQCGPNDHLFAQHLKSE